MSSAYITPTLVKWARKRAGLSPDELAAMLKLKRQNIEAWEEGEQLPTFSKAEDLADKLHIPFGYLFLSNPPKEEVPLPESQAKDFDAAEVACSPTALVFECAQVLKKHCSRSPRCKFV